MDDLCHRIARFASGHGLLEAGETVLAAFSGGPDSVALVLILRSLSEGGRLPLELHLAHLNHQLRPEADREERFCREFAEEKGLPLTVERVDVRGRAAEAEGSVESVARELRYSFLSRAARAVGAHIVATAHHADDVAETVLMRLLRGAGVNGLGAVPARRALSEGVTLVRPLMNVRKKELLAYLEERKQSFCRDASNRDTEYMRNRVRHELIPLLRREYPCFSVESLVALNESAAEATDVIQRAADELWPRLCVEGREDELTLDAGVFREAPAAVRKAVAVRAVRQLGAPTPLPLRAEHYRTLAALGGREPGSEADLPGGLRARREQGLIHFSRRSEAAPVPPRKLAVPGKVEVPECGYRLRAELLPSGHVGPEEAKARASELEEFLSAEPVQAPLTVRTRRPGDTFHPLGAPGRKKLKEFFIDARVPRHRRDRTPLVTDAEGRILWVVGHRIDDRFRLSTETKEVLHLRAEKLNADDSANLNDPAAGLL